LIASKREEHNQPLMARFEDHSNIPPPDPGDLVARMQYVLQGKEGKGI
jgi:hypothetical protein